MQKRLQEPLQNPFDNDLPHAPRDPSPGIQCASDLRKRANTHLKDDGARWRPKKVSRRYGSVGWGFESLQARRPGP